MPEIHNTILPFKYPASVIHGHLTVEVANGLSRTQRLKADSTIGVFNFRNIDNRENKFDYRSSERWQTKKAVDAAYVNYMMAKGSPTYDANLASTNVAIQAASSGFFQLWIETFINEPDVLKKLIHQDYFPGTHQQSFDPITGRPCNRNPLNINDKF